MNVEDSQENDSSPKKLLKGKFQLQEEFQMRHFHVVSQIKCLFLRRKLRKLRPIANVHESSDSSATDFATFCSFEQFCAYFQKNSTVTSLDFSGVTMSSLMFSRLMQALQDHKGLTRLNFGNTDLSNLSLKYICKTMKENTHLKTLNLFNVNILRENLRDLRELLRYNNSLEEINLNFCDMSAESVKELCEALIKAENIKKLKLSKNNFDATAFKALAYYLSKVPKPTLRKLDLSYNKISEAELQIVKEYFPFNAFLAKKFHNLLTLENINLSSNRINTRLAINHLIYILSRIEGIRKLNLSKNSLEAGTLSQLGVVFSQVSTKIDLSRNKFADNLPENLGFFSHLSELSLQNNQLSTNSCIKLANFLKNDPRLRILDLSSNEITSQDFEILLEGLKSNKTLEKLDVSKNFIENLSNFRFVCSQISIIHLDLSGNPLGMEILTDFFAISGNISLKTAIFDDINFSQRQNISKSMRFSEKKMIKMKVIGQKIGDLASFSHISLKNSHLISPSLLLEFSKASQSCLISLDLTNCCNLTNNDLRNIVKIIKTSPNLSHLSLNNLGLGEIQQKYVILLFQSLASSLSLRKVELSNNNLRYYFADCLLHAAKIANLTEISLRNNKFPNESYEILGDFVKSCENLKVLDLSGNSLSFLSVEALCEALKINESIETLKLSNTSLNAISLLCLGALLQINTKLRNIDLSYNNFLEKDLISKLTMEENNNNFKDFELSFCKLDDYQTKILLNFLHNNEKIQKFTIKDCKFYKGNLPRILKYIAEIPSLKELFLNDTLLNDKEICDFLIRLRKCRCSLKKLTFQELDVKTASFHSLCQFIQQNQEFEVILLENLQISVENLEEFAKSAAKNFTLRKISLKNTGLRTNHVEALIFLIKNSIRLKKLYLQRNALILEDFEQIIQRLRFENRPFARLCLDNNQLFDKTSKMLDLGGYFFESLRVCKVQRLQLSHCFRGIPESWIINFVEATANNVNLETLELNGNEFGDEVLMHLSEIVRKSKTLRNFSIADNNFSSHASQNLFQAVSANTSLVFLDISRDFMQQGDEIAVFSQMEAAFSKNFSLQFVDISGNNFANRYNEPLCRILASNRSVFFLNDHWRGLTSETACRILDALARVYQEFNRNNKKLLKKLKILNFSCGKLDDSFCTYFAKEITNFSELLMFDFSKNPKITLIGIKFIYVSLVANHDSLKNLQRIYFEEYNHQNLLNDGLAASLVSWSRYHSSASFIKRKFYNYVDRFFSKFLIRANKFQYCSDFMRFEQIFNYLLIVLFFLVNFILMALFSIIFPLILAYQGYSVLSPAIFCAYTLFSVVSEGFFWMKSRKFLNNYTVREKDWQKEVLINDIVNLVCGVLMRYDLYSDVMFILITFCTRTDKLFFSSLTIICVKIFLKFQMFFANLYQLIKEIRRKSSKNMMIIWNLIAKLSVLSDYPLIADILDRYCPGNANTYTRFLCYKLQQRKYVNIIFLSAVIKFFLEDIPQTVIQLIFVLVKKDYDGNCIIVNEIEQCRCSRIKTDPENTGYYVNYWIFFNISRLIVCLIISFYGFASLRPSYIEQSDFDERIESLKLVENKEESRRSIMKKQLKNIELDKTILQSIASKFSSMKVVSLSKLRKRNNKPLNPEEDFINLAVNSLPSFDNFEGPIKIEIDNDPMDSRVRLKRYFEVN